MRRYIVSQKNNSISQQLAKLDEIVAWFESDDFELEQAMAKYKEAEALSQEIETELSELKNEITVLKQKFDA